MIAGIGTDMVQVARMAQALANSRFAARVMGAEELADWQSRGATAQGCAGHWAVKEAVGKATGRGLAGIRLHDVMLLHDPQGAPYIRLTGGAADLGGRWHVSISHDGGMVLAFVVWEVTV